MDINDDVGSLSAGYETVAGYNSAFFPVKNQLAKEVRMVTTSSSTNQLREFNREQRKKEQDERKKAIKRAKRKSMDDMFLI